MAEVTTLERGDIYMAFPPTVDTDDPAGIDDVPRFYMISSVRDSSRYRPLVVGRKRLPDVGHGEREWAFVQAVSTRPQDIENMLDIEHYHTRTRGQRTRPPARPVAEGVYRLLRHGDHTHLVYALERDEHPLEPLFQGTWQ